MNGISILLKWPSGKTLDIEEYRNSLRLICDLPQITDVIDHIEDDTHPENDLLILDPDIILEPATLLRLQKTLYSSYFIGAVQPQTNYVMRSLESYPSNKIFAECAEYSGLLSFSEKDSLYNERFFHDYCVLIRGSLRNKLFGTALGICTKLRSGLYQGADLALSIQRFGYTCVTSKNCFFFRGKSSSSNNSDSLKNIRHDECLFRKLGRKINSERLTVAIPTCNNSLSLEKVLDSLSRQTCPDFDVVIQDDHSDPEAAYIIDHYDISFKRRISFYKNPFNVGSDSNIGMALSNVNTTLAWIISDEDVIKKDAVESIYKAAFSFPDSGILYFPVGIDYQNLKLLPMQTFYSLKHFISFFTAMSAERNESIGDSLLYLSDKVFRIPLLSKGMKSFYKYSYSEIPTTALLLKGLDFGIPCSLIPKNIIASSSELSRNLNLYDIINRMRVLSDLDLTITSKQRSDLFAMIYTHYKKAMQEYLSDNYNPDDRYLETIFISIYRYILPETNKQIVNDVIKLCKAPDISQSFKSQADAAN